MPRKMTKAKAKAMGGLVLQAYNAVPAKTKRKIGTRVGKATGTQSAVRKAKKHLGSVGKVASKARKARKVFM